MGRKNMAGKKLGFWTHGLLNQSPFGLEEYLLNNLRIRNQVKIAIHGNTDPLYFSSYFTLGSRLWDNLDLFHFYLTSFLHCANF